MKRLCHVEENRNEYVTQYYMHSKDIENIRDQCGRPLPHTLAGPCLPPPPAAGRPLLTDRFFSCRCYCTWRSITNGVIVLHCTTVQPLQLMHVLQLH